MSTGVWLVEVTAPAPLVVVTPALLEAVGVGGWGVGSTPLAVVRPKFCTVRLAVKVCPVVSADGRSKRVMRRSDPACTEAVLLVAAADVTSWPELASVP